MSTPTRTDIQASIRAKTLQLAQAGDTPSDQAHPGATEADAITGIINRDLGAADADAAADTEAYDLTTGQWEDVAAATALSEGDDAQAQAHAALIAGDTTTLLRSTRAAINAKSRALLARPTDGNGNRLHQ